MARTTRVGWYRRKDGTLVKGYTRAGAKPPRTERGERFLKLAFPNQKDEHYLDEQRDRLTREPWTWMDLERRRILKQVYPERYGHLPVSHTLYIERYHTPKDWKETSRHSSYTSMVDAASRGNRKYMGYTEFMDGSWIGYYTEDSDAGDKISVGDTVVLGRKDGRQYEVVDITHGEATLDDGDGQTRYETISHLRRIR